jgi:hypothetical protein
LAKKSDGYASIKPESRKIMLKLTKQEWKLAITKLVPIEAKPNPAINAERVFAYAIRDRKRERINSLYSA